MAADIVRSKGQRCVRFIPVEHQGNDNSSIEEAEVLRDLVQQLLTDGASWVDDERRQHSLRLEDILIITPNNAQVQQIVELLPGARVGTVDKFQGQQAPLAIYSIATSTAEDAPRGMEFIFSLNRLNVATSRARCVAAVVATPEPRPCSLSDASSDAAGERACPGDRGWLTGAVTTPRSSRRALRARSF